MRMLDLFSGIGGFSLAGRWMGWETVAFCEQDKFCQRVLAKHWPGVTIHDDIKTLDGSQYRGAVGIICGGFPCQPYSNAGERRGQGDDRALWPEMRRVISEVRPAWVLAENVLGLRSMGLDSVIDDLEALEYEAGAFVVPAAAVGAPHRRDRIWIIAHNPGVSGQFPTTGGLATGPKPARSGDKRTIADAESVRCRQADILLPLGVAAKKPCSCNKNSYDSHAHSSGCEEQHAPGKPGLPGQRSRRSDSIWSERQIEPGVCRVADGLPAWLDGSGQWPVQPTVSKSVKIANYQAQIKGFGNAIHPEVALRFFVAIEAAA